MESIAVLLPVRNAGSTLGRALRSLGVQTDPGLRVFAVDDGSTDASTTILRQASVRDPRITVLANPGRGLVAALETARRAAGGRPYLARMDADDISHPDRFRLQRAYLDDHPEVGAVGSRVALFPRAALGPGWRRYQGWLNRLLTPADHARERFVESPLAHPSVMMRAEAAAAVGGYRERPWAEDYDLWLRLVEAGRGLAKVNRTLLAWRHHQTRLSINHPRYTPAAFLAARAHFLARTPALAGRGVHLWGAGPTGRKLARLLAAEGILTERFYEVDPAKIGRKTLGVPVVSWTALEPAGRFPLVVAVGAPGARKRIRPETRARGYREGEDLFFAG